MIRRLLKSLVPFADIALSVVVYPAAIFLKAIRNFGMDRLPACRKALMSIGVFPIQDHYYEPLFDARKLRVPVSQERSLPGIEFNAAEQIELLEKFHFNEELAGIPGGGPEGEFHFNNDRFEAGDAE